MMYTYVQCIYLNLFDFIGQAIVPPTTQIYLHRTSDGCHSKHCTIRRPAEATHSTCAYVQEHNGKAHMMSGGDKYSPLVDSSILVEWSSCGRLTLDRKTSTNSTPPSIRPTSSRGDSPAIKEMLSFCYNIITKLVAFLPSFCFGFHWRVVISSGNFSVTALPSFNLHTQTASLTAPAMHAWLNYKLNNISSCRMWWYAG